MESVKRHSGALATKITSLIVSRGVLTNISTEGGHVIANKGEAFESRREGQGHRHGYAGAITQNSDGDRA